MCCFKDYRNFEKLNSIVQDALIVGIRLIQTLPEDPEKAAKKTGGEKEDGEKEGKKTGEGKATDKDDKENEKEKENTGMI